VATIPNVADIQRRVPTGSQPIATIRNAGAIGDAASSISEGLASVSRAAQDFQAKNTADEVATGNTGFSLDEYKVRNSFDGDKDYGTWVERYNTEIREKVGARAAGIGNDRERTHFLERAELRIEEGREVLKDKAFGIESTTKNIELDENLAALSNMVVDEQGDIAREDAKELIDAAVAMGRITPDDGENRYNVWRQKSAIAWISNQPPAKQREALDSDQAKNSLDTGVWQSMNEAAIQGDIAAVSDAIAQRLDDENRSFGEKIDQAEAIVTDSDELGGRFDDEQAMQIRTEVKRISRNQESDRRAADLDNQTDLHLLYYPRIKNGDINPDTNRPFKAKDIPKKDFESMTVAMRNSMFSAEGAAGSRTITRTPSNIIDTLQQLGAAENWSKMREYIIGTPAIEAVAAHDGLPAVEAADEVKGMDQYMTASHVNQYLEKAYDETYNPAKRRAFFTTVQTINNAMTGDDKSDRENVSNNTQEWIDKIYAKNGEDPSDKELRDFVDSQLMVKTRWYGNTRLFELNDKEIEEFHKNDMTPDQRVQYRKAIDPQQAARTSKLIMEDLRRKYPDRSITVQDFDDAERKFYGRD
tara:strand:+ start:14193 stop:15953 length:1761 start_codon:yes stop_codon:yes gene_type:complete